MRGAIDEHTFRQAFGRFATGVAVLSTRWQGLDYAMTANSLTSVSLDPPLMLFCVHEDSRFGEAVQATGTWGLSILATASRAAATWLATSARPVRGQLDQIPHRPGRVHGVALVAGSLATMECTTVAVYPGGDHAIVVGEAVDIDVPSDDAEALLYYRGQYGSVA